MYSIRVEEAINEPGKIDNNITGIEKHILGGTDEHYFLNKGNKTEGSKMRSVHGGCFYIASPPWMS